MRLLVAAILLGLVVIISGCSSTVKTDSNNGLVVDDFSVDPGVAEYNDNVRFYLDAENTGGTTATCVMSTLYGVDDWYDAYTGEPLASPTNAIIADKGITLNIFSGGMDFCYFDFTKGQDICASYLKGAGVSLSAFVGNSFTAYLRQYCSQQSALVSTVNPSNPNARLIRFKDALTPPLPSSNKAGQSWQAQWVLKPPLISEGLQVPYTVTSRTDFFYTSNAQVNIQAFNKDEFQRRKINGDTSINPSPLQVINVQGAPIQLIATKGDNPMIINQDPMLSEIEYFPYTFELRNVGQGYPLPTSGTDLPGYVGPSTESGYLFAVATVSGPGAFFDNCLGQTGEEMVIPYSYLQDLVKIRSDKRAPFGCSIGIQRDKWQSTPLGNIVITFQIYYRYYIDREVSVKVIGPERY